MEAHNIRKLDVYQRALEFAAGVTAALTPTPRGHAELVDQLRRAADSIALNICEGAGELSPREKARLYRIARRSATECVGAVDLLGARGVFDAEQIEAKHALLDRILAMLTRLVLRHTESQAPEHRLDGA